MTDEASVSVDEQIRNANPWYVGNQFEWALRPASRHIYERRYEFFVSAIGNTRHKLGRMVRLLDAGCGDGYWLARLSGLDGLDLTGVDYNPLRVERARHAAPAAHIVIGDLQSLIGERRFDVILLNQVIEHVEDDVALLQVVRRLLSDDGILIIGTPNEGSLLQSWNLRRTGALSHTDHVHFYTEREIVGKLERAGFRVDRIMREVFFVGHERLYYGLTARRWGFTLLELLTRVVPSGCSDYYFECAPVGGPEPSHRNTQPQQR